MMTSLKATNRQELEAKIINKARNDQAFKQQLLEFPTETILQELGLEYEVNGFRYEVLEETSDLFYLVLPLSPGKIATLVNDGNGISDQELEKEVVRSQSQVRQKCSEHSIEQDPQPQDPSPAPPEDDPNPPSDPVE